MSKITYKRPTAPTTEPVTIELARSQVGLTAGDTSMDTLLNSLIKAAREYVEKYTNRSLINATWTAYLDEFPSWVIDLYKLPISAIASVKYYDSDNELTALVVDTDYIVDTISEPARIEPAYNYSWPDTYSRPNAVQIEFTAGYGAAATDVPSTIQAAMLMFIAHMEANRGDEGFRTLPKTIEFLLKDYRLQII